MLDAQIGHEKTLTGLMTALAGANIIYGSGLLESGISYSHAQLVMDNDFFRMIKFVLKGIPVNDETLAIDVIKELGPGNDYMLTDHTMKYMRNIGSAPDIIDRNNRTGWEAVSNKDMATMAQEKAEYILKNHKPSVPISEETMKKVHAIVQEADEEADEAK